MAFDVDELKERIRRQRLVLAGVDVGSASPPAAVRSGPLADPLQTRRPRGERLYRLPVVGYLIRIAAGVANLPHILKNLDRHYAMSSSDRSRVDTQIGALRHELSQTAAESGGKLAAELQKITTEHAARLEAALAESARLRAEVDRLRGAVLRLACAIPELEPSVGAEDDPVPARALPVVSSQPYNLPARRTRPVPPRADGPGLALEEVGDLTQETALALTALPTGAPVLDFGGVKDAGYGRALRVFGLKPRQPEPEELDRASVLSGSCGAVWVDPAPNLTLDGLEQALAVLSGRLPRDAVTVVRGGSVRFEPALARLIAGHRGFRLERMLSAPEGDTALVLLRD